MSKDIHKWSDGRYTLMFDEHTFFVWDNEKEERMTALNVTKKLNEQQATIKQLESDKAIAEDYANIFEKENVKLRKQIDEQQATITELEEETEVLLENLFERQEDFRKNEKECHERIMNYQKEIKGLKNIIFNLKNEIHNLKNDNDYYTDKRRFDLYD